MCFTAFFAPSSTHNQSSAVFHVSLASFFFLLISLFIYLFLAVLGLHCCARAFSSCDKQGLLFVVVHGLLITVASLVVLLLGAWASVVVARGLSSCGM